MWNKKEEILEAVIKTLPYSNQIKNLDMSSEQGAIRFTWRGNKFRIAMSGLVEEVGDGVLSGTDICIIFQELLKVTTSVSKMM